MMTKIIAEIGVNHNASLREAIRLIEAAKYSGADFAKFQAAVPEEVVSSRAPKAAYQISASNPHETQLEMTRKIHLDLKDFKILKEACNLNNIPMMVSGFGPISNSMIAGLNLSWWKVPSGEITNLPYLSFVGAQKGSVILSTGMSTMQEIEAALGVLINNGTNRDAIVVLQCTSAYPTPIQDVNLNAMVTIKETFGVRVGFSDHTTGPEASLAAVALGAEFIEKHFTLNRDAPGPDHRASTEPEDFRQLVIAIRNVEASLGRGEKQPSVSEIENMFAVRRSIVANSFISRGEMLTDENLAAKRPSGGISPMDWNRVVGTVAIKDFRPDEEIELA